MLTAVVLPPGARCGDADRGADRRRRRTRPSLARLRSRSPEISKRLPASTASSSTAHPANVEARSNLGVVLMHLGRYEEAIAEYQTALTAAPSNATVRLNLGLAFYKAVRLEDGDRGVHSRAGCGARQLAGEISRGGLSAPSRPSG